METSNVVRHWAPCIVTVWAAVLLVGGYVFTGYSLVSLTENNSVSTWPTDSILAVGDGEFHAVLFVHPKCVCSRATFAELDRVLIRAESAVRISCVFYCPADQPVNWVHDQLWDLAGKLENCSRMIDSDGKEARRFGVQVSGHIMLFNRSNEQVFSGGITSSRGHAGDNLGGKLLTAFLNHKNPSGIQPPPFGCRLFPASSLTGDRE